MTQGRNEPCECGSGKKYKKCCFLKPTPTPEHMRGRCVACGQRARFVTLCKSCGKEYEHCVAHETVVVQTMRGHILRVHPETVSNEIVDRLLDSSEELALIYRAAKEAPELWTKCIERLEERRKERAS